VPLYKAQNTSDVSQKKLIGMRAKVISAIIEDGYGMISYVVNGKRYNAPAQHISKQAIAQGEEVSIYEIKDNLFYVQPLDEKIK
jgi:membrane protein implicated in regulation of membrane protease activity